MLEMAAAHAAVIAITVAPECGRRRTGAGTEALAGLVLITWSASFTYLEMERYWRSEALQKRRE
jgi:hypothetical protein